jgi:hypothetical protein
MYLRRRSERLRSGLLMPANTGVEIMMLTRIKEGIGTKMKASKRKPLEAKGWRLTSAEEFLGLTREEVALVEMKLALADAVKAQREKAHLSQIELAARIASREVPRSRRPIRRCLSICWCGRYFRLVPQRKKSPGRSQQLRGNV